MLGMGRVAGDDIEELLPPLEPPPRLVFVITKCCWPCARPCAALLFMLAACPAAAMEVVEKDRVDVEDEGGTPGAGAGAPVVDEADMGLTAVFVNVALLAGVAPGVEAADVEEALLE